MNDSLDINNQKVLLACLNWGKGHVARSIGLVHELLNQKNEVTIAGDTEQIAIFKSYFPKIKSIHLEKYPFLFSGNGNFSADLWKSRKEIQDFIQFETNWLEDFLKENEIDIIISDHRYGFYSPKVKSIFVTHQLNVALRWWQFPAQRIHHGLMQKFNEIWILDTKDSELAGKLSRNRNSKNVKHIGHFSRFMFAEIKQNRESMEVVICNGPEPYDEQLLLKYLDDSSKTIIAPVRLCEKYSHEKLIPSKDWLKCDETILTATKIYAYCGYSTLMDLKFLNCDSELFPTKGQNEQEYLARRI